MPYTSFAVAGAGMLGARIVQALVDRNASVVVLARPDSKSISNPLLQDVKIATVDYANIQGVSAILRENNVEVLIFALPYPGIQAQKPLAGAAKEANVKLLVPSDFGMPSEGYTEGFVVVKEEFANHVKDLGIPMMRIFCGLFMESFRSLRPLNMVNSISSETRASPLLLQRWTMLQVSLHMFSRRCPRHPCTIRRFVSKVNVYPSVPLVLCTRRVSRLCLSYKWTGFRMDMRNRIGSRPCSPGGQAARVGTTILIRMCRRTQVVGTRRGMDIGGRRSKKSSACRMTRRNQAMVLVH